MVMHAVPNPSTLSYMSRELVNLVPSNLILNTSIRMTRDFIEIVPRIVKEESSLLRQAL